VPLSPPRLVIITLVINACRSSSKSTDSNFATTDKLYSVCSVTLQPPLVLSMFSSNSIFPKCKTAATMVYISHLSWFDSPSLLRA
jgi:hypothetical protein